jgi:8-oxo-dGTP pyrophosphatase MutT (NUDIX family)
MSTREITTLCEGEVNGKPMLALKKLVDPDNDVSGYFYSHESRCNGKIIALLPYRIVAEQLNKVQLLVRNEVTPCWGTKRFLSSITGGFEGGDPRDTAILEMKEEAGYDISSNELISLGTSFASKSADTQYYLYSANLAGKKQRTATTDGSMLEKKATCIWMSYQELLNHQIQDPQVYVLLTRLMLHLNRSIIE